jgi:hypothetical protein
MKHIRSLIAVSILVIALSVNTISLNSQPHVKEWIPDKLSSNVFHLALQALEHAKKRKLQYGKVDDNILTIIDYSQPSIERRLWVLDLKHKKTLFYELVAHGKYSGDNLTTSFSNQRDSKKSSFGVFLTGTTYYGDNDYSLKLYGLEQNINDNAERRKLVIHGADYVSQESIKALGRLGRSHGCPAVKKSITTQLINTLKNNKLIFAYYPDPHWLSTSIYLDH